jgi:acyl-CoA dehydrogenase
MDFDFSDDQKSLAEEVGRVLEREGGLIHARRCLDEGTLFSAKLWSLAGELGWCGIAIPEDHGGLGIGYLELCLIAEQLGRNLAPVPFSSSIFLAAEALIRGGTEQQQSTWLPRLASGECIGTATLADSGVVFASDAVAGKIPILVDGLSADFAVIPVTADGTTALALVDLTGGGTERTALADLDPTRPGAGVRFDHAPATLLGQPGDTSLVRTLGSRAAAMLAFEQLGVADACLEQAVAFAKQRYAFGKQVGGFQAIKHKLANVWVANQLARSHAYYAAWALAVDAPELELAAAAARVAAGTASQLASQELIQVHGGIGFTWEMDCHLFYRRAKHLNLRLGSPVEWKLRLADTIAAAA